MEIEVGMYVRTKWGYICEIININEFREPSMKYGVEANYLRDVMFIGEEDILKASDNIIELIEVGDYVNGYKVDFVQNNEIVYNHNHPRQLNMFAKDIKSIVTKEQFERCMYKVGE